MSMDVSTLAITVTSTGIKDASDALGVLSRSAGTADKRVESLTDKLSKLMDMSNNTTGAANGLNSVMGLIVTALQSASAQAQATASALAQMTQGMTQLTQNTNQSSSAMQTHSYRGNVVKNTLEAMTTAALAYFSVRSAKNIIEESDAWGMMQSKLKIVTGSMADAKEIQQGLYDMAQRTRAPLEDMGKLYTRLAKPLQNLGQSSEQTKNMVESVSLALKLQGATAGEAASTMLQFSQSAAAGRLNGAEFNSVAENGTLILTALSEYLGKNQAELKKMGAQGKLTFDIISEALNRKLPEWRDQFNSLPMTFESAMQRLKNAWFKAVGEIGQDAELGKKLSDAVLTLEQKIPEIVSAIVSGFAFVIDNGKMIATVFTGIVGILTAKWAMEAAAAFLELARTTGVLAIAVNALGGPIGLIAGLLAAGVAAWALWGGKGEETSKNLTAKTEIDVDARIVKIRQETEELKKRNDAAAGGTKNQPQADAMSEGAQQTLDKLIALRKTMADPNVSAATKAALQITIDQKQAQFEVLLGVENEYKATQKLYDQKLKNKQLDDLKEQLTKKVGSPQERADIEVKDWQEKFQALGATLPADLEAKIREKYTKELSKSENEMLKLRNAATTELDKQVTAYNKMQASLEWMQAHPTSNAKLTPAQQEGVDIQAMRDSPAFKQDSQAEKILAEAAARNLKTQAIEREKESLQAGLKAQEDYAKSQDTAIATAKQETQALQDKINEYGKAKGSVDDLVLSKAQENLQDLIHDGALDSQIAKQRELVAALQERQDAQGKLGQLSLLDSLSKQVDKSPLASFGNEMAAAFGKVGKEIDNAGKALDKYHKQMVVLDAERKKALNIKDDKTQAAELEAIRIGSLKSEVEMYGSMASAAKGFFSQKTVAYKVFDAFETGLRMAQIVLTWEEASAKIAAAEAALVAKKVISGQSLAVEAAETTVSEGFSMTRAVASLTAGVAKAFEQMGVWGFIGAGAIIAFMASMGVHGGGGGGAAPPPLSEQRQKEQGTGTVLGDSTAKSDSIQKSLDAMKDNSNVGLVYTSQMVTALNSIDLKMGGLSANIASVPGFAAGTNFGVQTGTSTSGIHGLWGTTTTKDIQDTGLTLNGTASNLGVQQYLDVQTTSKGSGFLGIGGKTSTSNQRDMQGVSGEMSGYIGGIFKDINDTIIKAGGSLGYSEDAIKQSLDHFVISTSVSLKDLKGADLDAALKAVFSSTADSMAKTVLPQLQAFQKTGEGMYETLTRVASGTEKAHDALDKLGVGMVSLWSVTNKTGDIDVELVRDSLMKKEAGTSLEGILKLLGGTMDDLIASYKTLTTVRNSMMTAGLGSNLSLDLIKGAGGVKALSDAFSSYFSAMYSKEDQAKIGMANLTMEFGRLNLAVPQSKEAYKALVKSLMAGDAASQDLAGKVLALAGTWDTATQAADALNATAVSDARSALNDSYNNEATALDNVKQKMQGFADSLKSFSDSLIMGDLSTKSEMEKYQTAQANYDSISAAAQGGDETAIGKFQQAAQDLLNLSRTVNASGEGYTNDYQKVLDATNALEKYTQGAADKAVTDSDLLKQQVDGLITVNASVLTVAQAIANLQAALALTTVPGSGAYPVSTIGGPTDTATATATAAATDPTGGKVGTQGVWTALEDPQVLATRIAKGLSLDGSHANGLDYVPFDGYTAELHKGERVMTAAENRQMNNNSNDALIAEISSLKDEVKALKEEQRGQTAALIDSHYDATDRAADKVVSSTNEAATTTAYAQRTQFGLN